MTSRIQTAERTAQDRLLRFAANSIMDRQVKMRYRPLGRTNWSVSEVGYGMWGLAGWTGSDDAETMALH